MRWPHKNHSFIRFVSVVVLRPSFSPSRPDPSNHRALNIVTSIPPSLQQQAAADDAAAAAAAPPLMSGKAARGRGALSNGGEVAARAAAAPEKLYLLRAPRRGYAQEDARASQEQKEAADDYERGGLKPRPIKSVAAIMAAAALNAGASPGKKPAHLRLTSIGGSIPRNIGQEDASASGAGAAGASQPRMVSLGGVSLAGGASKAQNSSMARFAQALKLPNKGSAAGAGALPATADSDDERAGCGDGDDDDGEERKHGGANPSPKKGGRHTGITPLTPDDSAAAAAAASADPIPTSPVFSPASNVAVVVAGAAGSSCCICTTTDFVEPWISKCAHICCSECWITWLNENPDRQCPECEAGISLEELRPIALCPICSAIPTEPWTAPCHHTACRECWSVWLAENPVCSECNQPVNKDQLPAAR